MLTDRFMNLSSLAMYLRISLSRHLCVQLEAHSNISPYFFMWYLLRVRLDGNYYISGENCATCHLVVGWNIFKCDLEIGIIHRRPQPNPNNTLYQNP
jgi:hypothetical protein